MSINPQDFFDWVFRVLLQAFPAAFRQQFAAEMAQVFRSLYRQTYHQSGVSGLLHLWFATIWDLAWAVLYQWWVSLIQKRTVIMQTNPIEHRDRIQPLSALQAGIAALPFLVFGISSLVSQLGLFHPGAARLPFWQAVIIQPYLAFNGFILIGLAVGLLAGFPRWAYAYLGWALLFGWWWSDMRFYGYEIGWKIWLPILGVFLVMLIIRRSLQPLRTLATGLWQDWTLPSLGLYILYGHVYMLYDENHHPYLLAFIAVTTLAVTLGAWGYFRSTSPLRRILALLAGLLVATALSVTSYATWDYQAYYGLPEGGQNDILVGVLFFVALAVLMFGNGLLARSRLKGT
jgi:hypothetical protein